MAVGVEDLLNDHIVSGYLSVPHGLNYSSSPTLNTKIKVAQGAKNNLPDISAQNNAICIKNVVYSSSVDDIVIILISGGGSALLPLPVPQISLADKLDCIKVVANAGGSIQQLNTMRKKLSCIKGGGLLSSCNSQQVISLIISDIIGDPLDLIASGPTVKDESTIDNCLEILTKLNVNMKIPPSVIEYLETNVHKDSITKTEDEKFKSCNNVLVGSNKILVDSVYSMAKEEGYQPFTISTTLEGDAEKIGMIIAEISSLILQADNKEKLIDCLKRLIKDVACLYDLDNLLPANKVCLILAGETTVNVKGNGRGGRNQHLVLSAMNHLKKIISRNPDINLNQLCILSAGTDGQDGATDAAGASCDGDSIKGAMDLDMLSYLQNCGSYDFFTKFDHLDCLIKPGLTGTNVMDVQIILIDKGSD